MYWVNFLHIYQPFDQSSEILKRVVNESYRPLFSGLLKIPGIKINLNISAGLTELLMKNGYKDVVESIKILAQSQRLEFTESAKYHALLPFLERQDILRQIEKNNQTNRKYFGKIYQPKCFFPPEMAYSKKLGEIIAKTRYPFIILDEITYNGGKQTPPKDKLFYVGEKKLKIIFRERRVSNCIMSAIVRSGKEFIEVLGEDADKNQYLCTAMDGETFGHHRPGLEKSFFKILSSNKPQQIFISELPKYFNLERAANPIAATWASSKEDIDKGIQFYSWKNPQNKVHQLQWEFLNYVLRAGRNLKNTQDKLDQAVASDQFFWASGEPWWSIEMIEKGAWRLLDCLKSFPNINKKQMEIGKKYYNEILATAFWWQRSGKIEEKARRYKEAIRIPFKERTLESGKPEVYMAFIKMMEKKMQEAIKEKNFERAILWRDAIWKLETKNDIYDAIHAVDFLRLEVDETELKKLMDKYKRRYELIKPGQPELRNI